MTQPTEKPMFQRILSSPACLGMIAMLGVSLWLLWPLGAFYVSCLFPREVCNAVSPDQSSSVVVAEHRTADIVDPWRYVYTLTTPKGSKIIADCEQYDVPVVDWLDNQQFQVKLPEKTTVVSAQSPQFKCF